MTEGSADWEQKARVFPSPPGSKPARSLTYKLGGDICEAVIGHQRKRYRRGARARGPAASRPATRTSVQESGNTVISILVTDGPIEVWTREPALGWPNPSLVSPDAVVRIEYLDP